MYAHSAARLYHLDQGVDGSLFFVDADLRAIAVALEPDTVDPASTHLCPSIASIWSATGVSRGVSTTS
jgi:hypothetical protein